MGRWVTLAAVPYALLVVGLATPAAAKPASGVVVGRTYEVLLAVAPVVTVRLRVSDVLDDCWVDARGVDAAAELGRFERWNLCTAIAVRGIDGPGDRLALEHKSILATDEEALDDFAAVASRAEHDAMITSGAVRALTVGTRIEILELGAVTNRVRVLDGPSTGRVGLLLRDPW